MLSTPSGPEIQVAGIDQLNQGRLPNVIIIDKKII
jgi:hypothetical protein